MPGATMARPASLARHAHWIALVLGVALAAATVFGGIAALVGALLAQPLLALAVSWWRGTRLRATGAVLGGEAVALLALWALGFAASALLVAWPLASLRQSGSLPAALGLWWLLLPMLALGIWLYARDGRVAKPWWRR